MNFDLFKIMKSIKFQLIIMLLAMVYSILLLCMQYNKTIFFEKFPELLSLDEKIAKLATPVTVGIHINSFPEFSFDENNFFIDAIVWFRFAQATESLDTIGNFTIKNTKLLEDGSLTFKSAPIIKILDKDVLVCYHVIANFMSDVNFKKFPISDHRLNIILQNKSVTANELVFVTDPKNVTMSENTLVHNWIPKQFTALAGYSKAQLFPDDPAMSITYPCVAFSIDFKGVGARLPISLYLPLIALFFIILISLVLPLSDANRIALVSAGVSALVLFRLGIDSVSPHRVGYSTHIDAIYYLVVSLSLLVLLIQTHVVLFLKKHDTLSADEKVLRGERLDDFNATAFFVILMIFVAVLTYNYIW